MKRLFERARVRWAVNVCHGQKYTSSYEFSTKHKAEEKYEELINQPGRDLVELCRVSTDPELIPTGTERMTFKRNGGIDYYMAIKSQKQRPAEIVEPENLKFEDLEISNTADDFADAYMESTKPQNIKKSRKWSLDPGKLLKESVKFPTKPVTGELNTKAIRITEGLKSRKPKDELRKWFIESENEDIDYSEDAILDYGLECLNDDFDTLADEAFMAEITPDEFGDWIDDQIDWDMFYERYTIDDAYTLTSALITRYDDFYQGASESDLYNSDGDDDEEYEEDEEGEEYEESIRKAKLTENSKDPYKLAKKYNLNVFELRGIDVSDDPARTTYIAIAPDHRVAGSWTICLTDTEEIKAYQKYHQNGNWLVAVHKPFRYYEDACDWIEQNIDRNDTLEGDPVLSESKLREADEDYIRIGNRVYPNTTDDPGNAPVETILARTKKAYDQEQADKAEAARKAELERKGAEIAAKIKTDLQSVESLDDRFSVLFKYLVPPTGKANTIAGELVRAMTKILYRDFNDGDVFYDGYGKETCGSCAAFICNTIPEFEAEFVHIAENTLEEDEYTQALNQITEELLDYIMDNSYLLAEPNDQDMYDFDEDYFDEYVQTLEYDPDFSGDIEEYIRYDKISWEDVMDELSMFLDNLGIDSRKINQWARDAFTIEDLSPSELKRIEEEFPDFLRSYLNDLESQYGSVYELDEEEEEDEEEEDLEESKIRESLGSQEEDDIKDWIQNTIDDWKYSWEDGDEGCSQAAVDLMSAKDWFLNNMDEFAEVYGYELDSDAEELISSVVDICVDETIDYLEDSREKFTHLRQMIMDGNPDASYYDNEDLEESKRHPDPNKWKKGDWAIYKGKRYVTSMFLGGDRVKLENHEGSIVVPQSEVYKATKKDIYNESQKSRKPRLKEATSMGEKFATWFETLDKDDPPFQLVKDTFNDIYKVQSHVFPISYMFDHAGLSTQAYLRKVMNNYRGSKIKEHSGFNEGTDKIQTKLNSRTAQFTEKVTDQADLLYSPTGFKPGRGRKFSKSNTYGLQVTHVDNIYNDLKYFLDKDGNKVYHQYRVNVTPCATEDILEHSMSAKEFMTKYESGSFTEPFTESRIREAKAKRSFHGYDPDETFKWVADEGRDDNYFHPFRYYLNGDDFSDLRQKYANKLRKARADYAKAHPEYQDEYNSLMKWQSEASRKRSSARKEDPELIELAKKIADAERYSNYARKKGWWSTVKKQDALRDQLEQELQDKEKAYYDYSDPESRIYKTRPAAEHIDAYWALEDPIIDEYIKERDQQEQEFADALKDKKIYLGQVKGDDGKYHKSFFWATDDPEVFKRIGSRGRTSHPYGPNRGYSEFHIAPDARTEYEDIKAKDIEDLKEYPDPHRWEYDGCYDSTD